MLIMASGTALKLHTSSHWLRNVTGLTSTTVAGFQFYRIKEEPLTLCKMDSCLGLIFTNYLMATSSQSTLTYVFLTFHILRSHGWLTVNLG
jgi:hypothetical protein